MPRLAFMTFGVLHEPRDHPRSKGFIDRIPSVYATVERCEGYIDRSYLDPETGLHSWGTSICPSFVSPDLYAHLAHTFSLWRDLESVYAFAYADSHGEALRHRHDWFPDPKFPNYVAWWVADGHVPSVREATDRLEQLNAEGPTAAAFTFKVPFDADGAPAPLDRALIKAKIARNGAAG